MNAIEIRSLVKNFKEKQAVSGLNMTVPVGSIYGFIGENGSGKSTTEKMICGLLVPSSGEIKLFGKDYTDAEIAKLNTMEIETLESERLTLEEVFIEETVVVSENEKIKQIFKKQ